MVVIAVFTVISLCVSVVAPTFFPKTDISGFKNYINAFCIVLSFLSVGLGIFSIWQASESGKQANEMINSIQVLKQQQEILLVTLKSTNDLIVVSQNKTDSKWVQDNATN